eukprot:SAG11_NODE_24116_length_378_cov_0.444444_1_plen_104_part_01
MLEDALGARMGTTRATRNNWLFILRQLVQHLRWGIGAFWAPHYDTEPDTARGLFAAHILGTSPLYNSGASARLSQHRLCLPIRVAISPDGQKIVSASGINASAP